MVGQFSGKEVVAHRPGLHERNNAPKLTASRRADEGIELSRAGGEVPDTTATAPLIR
jgi:hypothetical protein